VVFLQRFEKLDKYHMSKHIIDIITHWLEKITIKNANLGGHKICPFAKMPRIVAVKKLSVDNFDSLTPELTIYMETEIFSSHQELEDLCRILKKINPEFVFLPDHPHKSNYINCEETGNGMLPCIIVQTVRELTEARSALEKTDYYKYWDKEYLKEIRSFD